MTRTTTTDLLAAVADIAAAGTAAADPAAAGTVADAAALTAAADPAAADPAAADSAAAGTAPDIAAAGTVADAADLTAAAGSLGSMGGLFSTTVLYALVCGIAVGGGLALLAVAVRGLPAKPEHEKQKASARAAELIRFAGQRGSLAAIVGLAVLLLTRWTVAGVAAAVLVFFWDRLFGGAAEERAAMRRVEALASWTESLRDTIAGAVGLEQAIPASARAAAPVLRPHLDALVDRLRSRTPLPEALQHLADEIDDASADIIVAALILNAKLRGPGLRQVLGALAKSAREEVDMRQRVMAQRASTRRSVQIVVAVTIAFVLGLAIFNREFVEPYGTAVGQLVLACVCGLFALGFWWLRKLSTIETPERFLVRDEAAVQFVRPRTPGAAAAAGQQQAEPGHAPSLRLPHQQGRGVQR